MNRKTLVLTLNRNRDKAFVRSLLGGETDFEMKWKLHESQYHVFPGKVKGRSLTDAKAWKNALNTQEFIILSSEADAEWFCENYASFLDRPDPVETSFVQ